MAELTSTQLNAVVIVPHVTGMISMIASALLVWEGLKEHRKGKSNAMMRAVIGIGVSDFVSSFGWFLSSWALPSWYGMPYSTGNDQVCAFQGFLLQLAIGAVLYNGILILFYTLVIRYGYTDRQLATVEKIAHTCVWMFVFGTAFTALGLRKLNPAGSSCWIANPQECYNDPISEDAVCNAKYFSTAFFCIPLWICEIGQIWGLALIYNKVRSTHKRLDRYSLNGIEINARNRSSKDVNNVAIQALLYSIAFFVTWVPSTVYSVGQFWHIESYPLWMVTVILEPLQGVWNLIIFLRSRPESRKSIYLLFCFVCDKYGCGCGADDETLDSQRKQDKRGSNLTSSTRTCYSSRYFTPRGISNSITSSFKKWMRRSSSYGGEEDRTSTMDGTQRGDNTDNCGVNPTTKSSSQANVMTDHYARWGLHPNPAQPPSQEEENHQTNGVSTESGVQEDQSMENEETKNTVPTDEIVSSLAEKEETKETRPPVDESSRLSAADDSSSPRSVHFDDDKDAKAAAMEDDAKVPCCSIGTEEGNDKGGNKEIGP